MRAFWFFMLLMDLLIPLSMIIFGKRFACGAPASINHTFGYRTAMSMKNQDTWQYAHRYFGKHCFVMGLVLIPFSVLPLLFVWNSNINCVGIVGGAVCAVQLILWMVLIALTEKELKRKFDSDRQ